MILVGKVWVNMRTIESVAKFDDDLETLVIAMIDELKADRMQSLSAKRFGINKNIIIVNHDVNDNDSVSVMVNPQLVWSSSEAITDIECSIDHPGKAFNVKRAKAIEIEYQDLIGATCHTYFTLGLARTILREFDYVNGVTIVDEPAAEDVAVIG